MSKWLEVKFQPDQVDLQEAVLEHFQDCRHPTPRDMAPDIRIEVPLRSGAEEFLSGLGLTWKEIYHPGRARQGKGTIGRFTVDKAVAEYINRLPDGERSQFVNDLLREGIQKRQNGFLKSDQNGSETP